MKFLGVIFIILFVAALVCLVVGAIPEAKILFAVGCVFLATLVFFTGQFWLSMIIMGILLFVTMPQHFGFK